MDKKRIVVSVVTGLTVGVVARALISRIEKIKEDTSEADALDYVDDSISGEQREECKEALRFLRKQLLTDAPLSVYMLSAGELGTVYYVSGFGTRYTVLRVDATYELLECAYDDENKDTCYYGKTPISLDVFGDSMGRVIAYAKDELGTDKINVIGVQKLNNSYIYTVRADGQRYEIYVEGSCLGFVKDFD